MTQPTPNTHGGRRTGAGAPPTKALIAELRQINLSLTEQYRAIIDERNALLQTHHDTCWRLAGCLEEHARLTAENTQLRTALQAANSTVHATAPDAVNYPSGQPGSRQRAPGDGR
jgi:hypothetical protein